jgi:hypothetical protein
MVSTYLRVIGLRKDEKSGLIEKSATMYRRSLENQPSRENHDPN